MISTRFYQTGYRHQISPANGRHTTQASYEAQIMIIDIDKSTQLNSDDLEHQKVMCEQSPICSAYFGGIQHTVFQSSAIGKIGLSVGCAKQVNIQKLQSALQSNSPEFILIFGT